MADVLRRSIHAQVHLTNNGETVYKQDFYDEDQTYTESTGQRLVIGTNTAVQEIDLSGVGDALGDNTVGAVLFIESSREINVAVNSNAALWPLDGALLLTADITHLYVQNTNTTHTATVEIVVTD